MNKRVKPIYPYYLVKVIHGVDTTKTHKEGLAEVRVDNKFEGQYMDECEIIDVPVNPGCLRVPYLEASNGYARLKVGDHILAWSTAVKPFRVPEYGDIFLVKEADIFATMEYDDENKESELDSEK